MPIYSTYVSYLLYLSSCAFFCSLRAVGVNSKLFTVGTFWPNRYHPVPAQQALQSDLRYFFQGKSQNDGLPIYRKTQAAYKNITVSTSTSKVGTAMLFNILFGLHFYFRDCFRTFTTDMRLGQVRYGTQQLLLQRTFQAGFRIRSIFGQIQQIRIFKTGSGSGSGAYWHLQRMNSNI